MSWRLRSGPGGFATRWSDEAALAYRAAGYWRDETLRDFARRTRDAAPARPLLVEGDQYLTRAEAWDASLRLAAFFQARGLVPGDVVSFQLPNWIESAIVALAARMSGLVLNPVPPIYREAEVGFILADCRAKLAFVPEVFRRHDHLVRGPEALVGYVRPEDEAGAFDDDGFFRMGDLGRRVHGDWLVVTGRKKDIIIRSGENLSPKEVEDALSVHPAVADVAIVAMPSLVTGEKGCAFVVLRSGHALDLSAIRRFLERSGLARQKFPEHLVVVDELPRVPSGKIARDVLRTRARKIAEEESPTG